MNDRIELLEDNVEWEMPSFVILNNSSGLDHKRIYSTFERLKLNSQMSQPNYLKREFSVIYEQCSLVKNTEPTYFNRLSHAKISFYCSLNYPNSVKRAYKELLFLWEKHIEEFPEYWEGFDVMYMKNTTELID